MDAWSFSDVLIQPNYSEIKSRSLCDPTSDLGKFKLSLPLISANMKHVTGPKMVAIMAKYGGLGILHRFNSIEEGVEEFKESLELIQREQQILPAELIYKIGVSIGVNEESRERFEKLYQVGARLFCIDVAHGHHILVKEMIEFVKNKYADVILIAGNIATLQGALDLHNWGADIIKVGIGPGSMCQTRRNVGVGVPQIQALKEIREVSDEQNLNLKLIGDGGIKYTGDISKCLVYADAVMIGWIIAGTSETPGNVYQDPDGKFYKVYAGSASGESKNSNGQKVKFIEGMTQTVPFRGKVKYILIKIKENLQSAMSYAGAQNMEEFKNKAQLKAITFAGQIESKI